MFEANPKICYLTAGAANMYCGSCLRDNTLATALKQLGCDIQLFPTYTPTRTDEPNVSEDRVLLGGINLYLQQKMALFRKLPPVFDRWLNHPRLIKALASRQLATTGHEVGRMTLSLLKGEFGNQSKEIENMALWIKRHTKPDLIHLTNVLLAGCVPLLRKHLATPILVSLQGENLFLDETHEPYRSQTILEIRKLVAEIDGFIAFSQYYADFMSDYFAIPSDKINVAQMGISVDDFVRDGDESRQSAPSIGYLARVCPEKGLHLLVDAFIRLREMAGTDNVKLQVAGWMNRSQRNFLQDQVNKLTRHGLHEDFEYVGAVDRRQKVAFLRGLNAFSVPTTYPEPNGIYLLEALAAGVPAVQPCHGMFPELLTATGGGLLVKPNSVEDLANGLHRLLSNAEERAERGRTGQRCVLELFSAQAMAESVLEIYRSHLTQETTPLSLATV